MIKPRIVSIDCWKTRILACKRHPFESMRIQGDVILELNHYESIKPLTPLQKSITIEADPFLFVKDDRLFVFYESKIFGGNGVIKMTSTADLTTWTNPVTVLTEKCHLSYPFVFDDAGEVYMIPETGALRSIRLYKASDKNLTRWEYRKTLVKEDGNILNVESSFCDSSIIKLNDAYYLFTTVIRNNINELHLYYSQNLYSPFQKHPLNPVIKSNKYGRNAGNILEYEDSLWRVTQECINSYGENVNVTEIIEVSPQTYKEKISKESIFEGINAFYHDGAHQLNVVRFKDKFIVATDAKGYRKVLLQRLLSKLLHFIRNK